MKDQLSRPLRFLSAACLLQLSHLAFCFPHFALAASHCFCVHFETSSVVDFALSVVDGLVDWAIDAVGARAVPTATAPAIAIDMTMVRICGMTSFSIRSSLCPLIKMARASIMLRRGNSSRERGIGPRGHCVEATRREVQWAQRYPTSPRR